MNTFTCATRRLLVTGVAATLMATTAGAVTAAESSASPWTIHGTVSLAHGPDTEESGSSHADPDDTGPVEQRLLPGGDVLLTVYASRLGQAHNLQTVKRRGHTLKAPKTVEPSTPFTLAGTVPWAKAKFKGKPRRVVLQVRTRKGWKPARKTTARRAATFRLSRHKAGPVKYRFVAPARPAVGARRFVSKPVTVKVAPEKKHKGYDTPAFIDPAVQFGRGRPNDWTWLNGVPSHWLTPCRPLRWAIDTTGAPHPQKDIAAFKRAFKRVSGVSGAKYKYVGLAQPGTGRGKADIKVQWGGVSNGNIAEAWVYESTGVDRHILSADIKVGRNLDLTYAVSNVDGPVSAQHLYIHEISHTLGLGHAKHPNQVLYPYIVGGKTLFGNGDRTGLWEAAAPHRKCD